MDSDIRARIDALTSLLDDLEMDAGTEVLRTYSAIKALCADLEHAAEDYAAAHIDMVLSEVEQHAAALAGLMPSWELPRSEHSSGARAAVEKLGLGTCFGRP